MNSAEILSQPWPLTQVDLGRKRQEKPECGTGTMAPFPRGWQAVGGDGWENTEQGPTHKPPALGSTYKTPCFAHGKTGLRL